MVYSLLMRALLLSAIVFSTTLVFGNEISPSQRPTSSERASPVVSDAGKKLFGTNCAGCHGLDARGGEHAPNIATNADVHRKPDDQLFRIVRDGAASGTMPAFGSILSNGNIQAVVAYLRSLQGDTSAAHAALPGDPMAGKLLFFGKASCSQCHAIVDSGAGSGGFIAPDLTAYAAAYTPAEILHAITNPNDNLNPRARSAVIVTRDGQKLTGFIRNQDNFSIQFQSLDGTFHLLERSGLVSVTYDPKSLMPADYSQRLTNTELNDVVSFLMRTAAADSAHARQDKKKRNDDDDDH